MLNISESTRQRRIQVQSKVSRKKFIRMVRIMAVVYKMLRQGGKCTKREVFYRSRDLYRQ